jgi:hypothetical protein
MTKRETMKLINTELKDAIAKYPDWPTDIIHAAAVVNEEAGELIRACLNYHYHGVSAADVRHVLAGDIIISRKNESIGGGKYVSTNSPSTYLGTCRDCPDQCGVDHSAILEIEKEYQNEYRATGTLL